jgi:hypothetical protein
MSACVDIIVCDIAGSLSSAEHFVRMLVYRDT